MHTHITHTHRRAARACSTDGWSVALTIPYQMKIHSPSNKDFRRFYSMIIFLFFCILMGFPVPRSLMHPKHVEKLYTKMMKTDEPKKRKRGESKCVQSAATKWCNWIKLKAVTSFSSRYRESPIKNRSNEANDYYAKRYIVRSEAWSDEGWSYKSSAAA